VAVSKQQPVQAVRLAYQAGQRDFGESYVQELASKADSCKDLIDLSWHLVGRLQRNKAQSAVRYAKVVHSVDSARLAKELGRRAASADHGLSVLVQINLGAEPQKGGCAPGELEAVLQAVESESALKLAGLMTVPPQTPDPSGARPYFDALVKLRDQHGGQTRLPELSMGMSFDLEQAVAAGATLVRVGSAIFGERGD
jgi:hypothetical protein